MIPKLSESFGMFRKVSETIILRENGYCFIFIAPEDKNNWRTAHLDKKVWQARHCMASAHA